MSNEKTEQYQKEIADIIEKWNRKSPDKAAYFDDDNALDKIDAEKNRLADNFQAAENELDAQSKKYNKYRTIMGSTLRGSGSYLKVQSWRGYLFFHVPIFGVTVGGGLFYHNLKFGDVFNIGWFIVLIISVISLITYSIILAVKGKPYRLSLKKFKSVRDQRRDIQNLYDDIVNVNRLKNAIAQTFV